MRHDYDGEKGLEVGQIRDPAAADMRGLGGGDWNRPLILASRRAGPEQTPQADQAEGGIVDSVEDGVRQLGLAQVRLRARGEPPARKTKQEHAHRRRERDTPLVGGHRRPLCARRPAMLDRFSSSSPSPPRSAPSSNIVTAGPGNRVAEVGMGWKTKKYNENLTSRV